MTAGDAGRIHLIRYFLAATPGTHFWNAETPARLPLAEAVSSLGWTRTNNRPINSRMLCLLSYEGSYWPRRL